MAKYQFSCKKCERIKELKMSFEQYTIQRQLGFAQYIACDNCGGTDFARVYDNTPVIFKGDDFTKSTKEE